MAKSRVIIQGLAELKTAMRELPLRVAKKVTKKAAAEGAKGIVKEAKLRAPLLKDPVPHRKRGTLKKNIKYRVRASKNGQQVEATIWVKSLGTKKVQEFKANTGKQSRENPDDPYYWWMVEFGTLHTAAQPFIRPAFEAKKDASLDKIVDTLDTGIQEEAKGLNRNNYRRMK